MNTQIELLDMYWKEFVCGTTNKCHNLMLNNDKCIEEQERCISINYTEYIKMRKEYGVG